MLLNSVIIILREVLEAAMLISVLLAIGTRLNLSASWVGPGFAGGVAGAIAYALCADAVSGWFAGVGQEVVNAVFQVCIYFMLLFSTVMVTARVTRGPSVGGRAIPVAMMVATCLAMTREGFEVIIYLHSFMQIPQHLPAVIMGAIVGASIGICVGILFYYLLRNIPGSYMVPTATVLLMLVAAGMSSQAALLLIQADWLPSQLPLWDSSGWLPETGVTGQVLYALVGYEATPTAVQLGFYAGGLLIFLVLVVAAFLLGRRPDPVRSPR